MSDLVDFLMARIEEDERLARRAMTWPSVGSLDVSMALSVTGRHLLADCEAKRAIVELHKPYRRIVGIGCEVCLQPRHLPADAPGWPCETLRLLAVSYSSHPDFRAEWLPAGWSVENCRPGGES